MENQLSGLPHKKLYSLQSRRLPSFDQAQDRLGKTPVSTKILNLCVRVTALACMGDLLGFRHIPHPGKSPDHG
jgi:hypothetical protein